jgi:predicted transcriptional regulator
MTTELAPLLTALADPTRRRVVQLLRERPYRAGELAAASGTSAPTMSRPLRVLLEAGDWLDELQAASEEQLASFKRYVEGRSE